MCRVLGYCSRDQISVSELLGEAGLEEFTALSIAHSDGWGMAALDGAERHVAKSPGQASEDPEYHRLAKERLGDTGLVHLRWATPGLPVEDRNTHPFTFGEYAFAHNGAIHPQNRLPELLPPGWEQRLAGTTDSERYFLRIMSGLEAGGGDMVAAIADTVRIIRRDFSSTCLNAILLGPDALYAISWHDPERIPYDSLADRGRLLPPWLAAERGICGDRLDRLAARGLEFSPERFSADRRARQPDDQHRHSLTPRGARRPRRRLFLLFRRYR
jgi:predicted glutamine amidotransferase